MEPLLLKAADVAQLLGLGRSKVFAMLASGELPVVRMGRSVRVPRGALQRWIVERTQDASRGQGDCPPFLTSATCGHTTPDAGSTAVCGATHAGVKPREATRGHVRR